MNKKILIALLAIIPAFATPFPAFAKGDKGGAGKAMHHHHHRHHHRHHHHHHHHVSIVIK